MLINLFKFFWVNQDRLYIYIVSFIFQYTYKFVHELLHLLLQKKKKKILSHLLTSKYHDLYFALS